MVFLRKTHVKALTTLVLAASISMGGCGSGRTYIQEIRDMEIEIKAMQGDAQSQFIFGGWNLLGYYETPRNCELAIDYLEKSANQDYALAQEVLANEYYVGKNCVKKDYKKAFALYQKSADKGLAKSKIRLAEMYKEGKGTKKDHAKAIQWYETAALQGDPIAQYQLGLLYYHEKGKFQDYQKAFHWISLSANQGHILAEELIIEMYEKGQGVAQNKEEAEKWREKTKKNKLRKMVDTLRETMKK